MAANLTGTVVLWRVANRGETNERVQRVSDKHVSVYVDDEGDEDFEVDATATIISQYILDRVEEAKGQKKQLDTAVGLLKKRVNGLLRVAEFRRESLRRPLVPSSDESDD
jgi:hypothetical protein